MSAARGLFYFCNFLFWLSGAALLGIGVWLLADEGTFRNVVRFITEVDGFDWEEDSLKILAYLFITVGAFVFTVGFLGCCGAQRKSQCLLGLYMFFLIVVIIAEVGAGVMAVIYRNQLTERVQREGSAFIFTKYMSNSDAAYGLNFIQYKWECCGVKSLTDYKNSVYSKATNYSVSPFCCVMKDNAEFDERVAQPRDQNTCMEQGLQCINGNCLFTNQREINNVGCLDAILEWVKTKLPIFIGVGIGIACLELIVLLLAVYICRQAGKK